VVVNLGQIIHLVCPACGATFPRTQATVDHIAAEHLGGLEKETGYALSAAFNLHAVLGDDGITEMVGLHMLVQFRPGHDDPAIGPDEALYSVVEVLFVEDHCRQLGALFTQMADPTHRARIRASPKNPTSYPDP
jgi:hypothetical protein